jgi:hypothetical protein
MSSIRVGVPCRRTNRVRVVHGVRTSRRYRRGTKWFRPTFFESQVSSSFVTFFAGNVYFVNFGCRSLQNMKHKGTSS